MKVYFSHSNGDYSNKIANYLRFKLNNKNVLLEKSIPDPLAVDEMMANKKALVSSDAVIIDITGANSVEVGYTLSMAMSERKRVLIIREKGKAIPPTGTLDCVVYEDIESMTKIVDKFLTKVQSESDTKFILILPREIDSYLTWASNSRRRFKAQIVRDAIESIMVKDRDYKQYLKNA